MKTQRTNFSIHRNFKTMILIRLFYCCEKVFIHIEYMNDWKNFVQTVLPEKEDFNSHLNTEDITNTD